MEEVQTKDLNSIEIKKEWKKESFFNGDFEVYSGDKSVLIDKVSGVGYVLPQKDNKVIEFLQKLEKVVLEEMPQKLEDEHDVDGYKIEAYVYDDTPFVPKMEISQIVSQFVNDNYKAEEEEGKTNNTTLQKQAKEIEQKLKVKVEMKGQGGKSFIIVHGNTFAIKDRLKEMGFRWDKEKKQWSKEGDEETLSHTLEKLLETQRQKF